jgi:hypothetical protein
MEYKSINARTAVNTSVKPISNRYGPAPYYGELPYSGRMIQKGFTYGQLKSTVMGHSSESTRAEAALMKNGFYGSLI